MSLTLLEQLKSSITPQLTSYAAKLTGETPANIEKATSAALPAILSGIASATRLPSGLSVMHRLVTDPVNDGTLLHQLPALYQGTMSSAPVYRLGTQLLQAIFANKLSQVTQTIAVLSSVKPAASAQLVSTLAPHVLAVIGERQRAGLASTPASLAGLLDGESAGIAAMLPPSLGQIFGVPVAARAAAGAARAASAAGLPKVAARAGQAATASKAARPFVRTAAQPTSGAAPWIIFPIGLIFGTGLAGLGSLMAIRSDDSRPAVIAAAPAPAPVQAKAPAAPVKVAEAKPAAVPAPPAAKPAPAKTPETKPATKTAEKSAEAKPTTAAKSAETASVKAPKPEAGTAAPAPAKAQPLAPGVTTYFGQTPSSEEAPARPNPDYKPAMETMPAVATAAVVAATTTPPPSAPVVDAPLPVGPPGITTFFGDSKPAVEMAAQMNPDYQAAPPAPPAALAVAEVPPQAPVSPGVTTFFGSDPVPTDQPAKPNPDYQPAPAVQVADVPPNATPAPGVTTFFGSDPGPADQPAKPNPDYQPATAPNVAALMPAAAVAPAAPGLSAAGASGLDDCRTAVAEAVKSGTVLFKSARADLNGTSLPTLERIAHAFKSCPATRLTVEGHTDDTGLAEMNQKLSEARAQTVSSFLVMQGIEANRIRAAGFGPTRPLVPNTSPANKAQNRRIEFVVDAM